MSDSYRVLTSTIIAGRFFDKGAVLTEKHQIHADDIEAALAGKFVEKVEGEGDETVKVDATPSELTTQHETKRVVSADKAADKKAAQEG